MLLGARSAAADEMPAATQAELITRLAAYDRNMKARAGERVNIVVVVKPGDGDSERAGAQLVSALGRCDQVGALPHAASTIGYAGATGLLAACKANRTAVAVLTPALASEVEALGTALDGADLLTIAPSADMTRRGVVLGFELVSSRPKLFINLAQAARQNVSMPSELLKLMTVFR
ncbi:MAG TPA: YfiR family protein [Labilithrix sp.]|nr:YfiR family protein [Labilithrix sp.]